MGLFDLFKREKETCPLCSEPLGLLNSIVLGDGSSICNKCANGLRSVFPIEEREEEDEFGDVVYNSQGNVSTYLFDHLSTATLEDVQRVKREQEFSKIKAQADLGGEYGNVFTVSGDVFPIAPKAFDVGLIRAKQLKNRLVAEGLVQSGSFTKGDVGVLLHEGRKLNVKILEVHKKDVGSFQNTISANMSKSAKAGDTAWLILDLENGIAKGDVVAKQ